MERNLGGRGRGVGNGFYLLWGGRGWFGACDGSLMCAIILLFSYFRCKYMFVLRSMYYNMQLIRQRCCII